MTSTQLEPERERLLRKGTPLYISYIITAAMAQAFDAAYRLGYGDAKADKKPLTEVETDVHLTNEEATTLILAHLEAAKRETLEHLKEAGPKDIDPRPESHALHKQTAFGFNQANTQWYNAIQAERKRIEG